MPITLPQFKNNRHLCRPNGPMCSVCQDPDADGWRLFQLDTPDIPVCPWKDNPTGQKMTGLGDVVERITSSVGIKSCGGCKARKEKLNKLVPFKAT